MRLRLALLATLALAVAGCGGGGGGGGSSAGTASQRESAASIAPASTQIFVSLDTDLESSQIQTADELLQKFPARDKLLETIRDELDEYGLDDEALRAAGPEVDVAVLDTARRLAVGFTQPRDEQKLIGVLDSQSPPLKHVEHDGWLLFSDRQEALDAVTNADRKLAQLDAYRQATAELPDEALAKAYAAPEGLRKALGSSGLPGAVRADWASAAAVAHDDGVEVQLHARGAEVPGGENFASTITDLVPAGSVLVLSFRDLSAGLDQLQTSVPPLLLSSLEKELGFGVDDLGPALSGEGVLYVRPGALIPQIALITKPADPARAAAAVDRIARRLAPAGSPPTTTTIDGTTVRRLVYDALAIFYGVVDGKLVVTNDPRAIRSARDGPSDPLSDDNTFKAARDASGLPDQTNGWLYVNLADGIPLVEALAVLGGQRIPDDVTANLHELRSAVLYGTRAGATQTLVAFVQTS
jgi:hypothetical protein